MSRPLSSKVAAGLRLIDRNPGLSFNAAAKYTGCTNSGLSYAFLARKARLGNYCQTCFRTFPTQPDPKAPQPYTQAGEEIVLRHTMIDGKLATQARRRPKKLTPTMSKIKIKATQKAAKKRLMAQLGINTQAVYRKAYTRYEMKPWKRLSVRELEELIFPSKPHKHIINYSLTKRQVVRVAPGSSSELI